MVLLVVDIMRLAATNGGNGDVWTRVSALISRMHDRSRDDDVIPHTHRSLESFVGRLRRWMRRNAPGRDAVDLAVDEVIKFLGMPAIRSTFSVHRRKQWLIATVSALKSRLYEVIDPDDSWDALCDRAEGRGAVPLMTIHKSWTR